MKKQGFCQKDNKPIDMDRGCIHPKDYCPFRSACIVFYEEKERRRKEKKQGNADVRLKT